MRNILRLSAIVLSGCSSLHSNTEPLRHPQGQIVQLYPNKEYPQVKMEIPLQGLSGLVLAKEDESSLQFWTLTDRGPNLEAFSLKGNVVRPFLSPDFQPRIYLFSVSKVNKLVTLIKTITLTDFSGKPLSGLPSCDRSYYEEMPVDRAHENLYCSNFGIDPESLGVDADGNFWIGEEYAPAVLQFSPKGQLLKAYRPKGGYWGYPELDNSRSLPILPENYLSRKPNRGLEALTVKGRNLFAMLQSPLPDRNTSAATPGIEIIQIDITTDKIVGHFWYPMENPSVDKIGDMVAEDDSHLLIIEQNSKVGDDSIHRVYRVTLPENSINSALATARPLRKTLVLDLVAAGYNQYEKVEGLALLSNHQLAVVNDNDFSVGKTDQPPTKTVMGIFPIEQKSP